MFDKLRMGFKPLGLQYSFPFTKVNGNFSVISNFTGYLLPSALADGLNKLILKLALATFWFEPTKNFIQ
jgi:hypothetical protein